MFKENPPVEVYFFTLHKGKLTLRKFIEVTIDFQIINFKRQEWSGMHESEVLGKDKGIKILKGMEIGWNLEDIVM